MQSNFDSVSDGERVRHQMHGFFKGVWIEVHYPPKGKAFVRYESSGPQFIIYIHKDDQVIDDYLQYVYDDGAIKYMGEFIDKTLIQCGITDRTERQKIWEHRVEYMDGVPKYVIFDQHKQKEELRKT